MDETGPGSLGMERYTAQFSGDSSYPRRASSIKFSVTDTVDEIMVH